jgi:hypothetical protein
MRTPSPGSIIRRVPNPRMRAQRRSTAMSNVMNARTLGTVFGVLGAAVGIYFGVFFKGGSSYTLQETLPKMVSDFGANARTVEILASTDNVKYEVIGADGLLHTHVYGLEYSRVVGGGTGKTRKTTNSIRRATAGELRDARVRLGEIAPGVVDKLLARVGFPHQGSSATLTGDTWTLESGARPFDKYQARYDGTGLRQTQTQATVFGSGASSGAPPRSSTSQSSPHTRLERTTGKLLACIQRAHQDVNKLAVCQQRFAP